MHPLISGEKVLGSLSVASPRQRAFDGEALTLIGVFAAHAAIALAGVRYRADMDAALDSRNLIGQAKGILMERHRLPPEQAFTVLVQASQQRKRQAPPHLWATVLQRRTRNRAITQLGICPTASKVCGLLDLAGLSGPTCMAGMDRSSRNRLTYLSLHPFWSSNGDRSAIHDRSRFGYRAGSRAHERMRLFDSHRRRSLRRTGSRSADSGRSSQQQGVVMSSISALIAD